MKIIPPHSHSSHQRVQVSKTGWREEWLFNKLGSYVELECGHFTTIDVQIAYSCWQPSKGKYFCEKEGKWVRVKPKVPMARLPDEPMF